jgi:bacterioferritin
MRMALRSPRASCRTAGTPTFHPDGLLTRSHSEYVDGTSLIGMIQEDQVAERVAIDSYREMIAYLGNDDPTTRRMLEGILAMEEEHAEDLVSLLQELGR